MSMKVMELKRIFLYQFVVKLDAWEMN